MIELRRTNDDPTKTREFRDLNGSLCWISESSLMTETAMRLGVGVDFEGDTCIRMHLNRDMAEALIPLLQHFVDKGELPE